VDVESGAGSADPPGADEPVSHLDVAMRPGEVRPAPHVLWISGEVNAALVRTLSGRILAIGAGCARPGERHRVCREDRRYFAAPGLVTPATGGVSERGRGDQVGHDDGDVHRAHRRVRGGAGAGTRAGALGCVHYGLCSQHVQGPIDSFRQIRMQDSARDAYIAMNEATAAAVAAAAAQAEAEEVR
jgi:hypothetical protein